MKFITFSLSIFLLSWRAHSFHLIQIMHFLLIKTNTVNIYLTSLWRMWPSSLVVAWHRFLQWSNLSCPMLISFLKWTSSLRKQILKSGLFYHLLQRSNVFCTFLLSVFWIQSLNFCYQSWINAWLLSLQSWIKLWLNWWVINLLHTYFLLKL